MGVCRYFQQGRCRYGDKCRFEHPTGLAGAGQTGQRVQFRDSFGTNQQSQYKWSAGQQQQQPQQTPQNNAADVVSGLPKEMQTWEQSKMWPFSCVAMEKDMPSLPDFLDVSPEELRLQAYTAMKDGSMQTYISKIQELVTDYNNKRHQLKLPSLELKQNLIKLLEQQRKTESGSVSSTKSSVFGASSSSSFGTSSGSGLFGKPHESSSANQGVFGSSTTANQGGFGSSAANQGLFGSSSANQGTFAASASSNSIFGGGSGAAGGSSIFGNTAAATSGMFGSPQPSAATATTGLFGSPQPTSAATTGLFGSPQPTSAATTGLFGSPQPTAATTTGLFGSPQPTAATTTGLFGSPQPASTTTTGLFGSPQPASTTTTGLFGSPQPTASSTTAGVFGSSFGATPSAGFGNSLKTNLFGAGTSSSPFGAGSFGASPQTPAQPATNQAFSSTSPPSGLFGNAAAAQGQTTPQKGSLLNPTVQENLSLSTVYTMMDKLTESEKAEFLAASFTLGKVPMKPPPKELIL